MKSIKILIAVLLLLPFATQAQHTVLTITDSTVLPTANSLSDSSKVTLSKVYNDAKSGLEGLSKALKVGAEHVYYILVKQQIVNSIVWLIVLIIDIFVIWGLIKYWKWVYKIDDEGGWTTLGVGYTLFTIVITGIVLSHIDIIVTGFVNPEYGAIKDIFDFVKPKGN